MHITTECNCGAVFELEPHFAGMTVECARCRRRFAVPQIQGQPAAAPQLVAPPPPKPVAQTPLRPRRSNSPGFGGLVVAVIVLLCLAVPIVAAGYLYLSAKRAVREVTQQFGGMAELVQNLPELGKLDETIANLKARGYEQVSGQVLEVREPVNRNTLYTCQALEIDTEVRSSVAIIAQLATIKGTVHGDIEFYGQMLQIEDSGVVKGNVQTKVAQAVIVDGTIEGKLTGGYQGLQNNGRIVGGVRNPKTAEAISSLVQSARDSVARSPSRQNSSPPQRSGSATDETSSRLEELVLELTQGNSIDRRDAAREVAGLKPEDKDRGRVVAALLPLMDDGIADRDANAALKVWISREELPRLKQALCATRAYDDDRLKNILALMAQLGEQQAVVAYLNHSNSSVRADVERHISQWSVAPTLIVLQCLKDLADRDRQTVGNALSNLKKLALEDDKLQRRVVAAVIPLLADSSHDDDAADLVSQYGVVDEDLPALMQLYGRRRNQRAVGRLIASTKDPVALKFLASQLEQGHSDIEQLFTELGPTGEPYMWPLLRNSSHIVRGRACRVLSKTGTRQSLAELERLLDDTLSKRDAQAAIDAIGKREVNRF